MKKKEFYEKGRIPVRKVEDERTVGQSMEKRIG